MIMCDRTHRLFPLALALWAYSTTSGQTRSPNAELRESLGPPLRLPHQWVVYVDVKNGQQRQDGKSWQTAFRSLQDGIDYAWRCGGEVWVAQGTYVPDGDDGRDAAFRMRHGVAIYGGFAGDEARRDGRNWRQNPTVLSGDIGRSSDAADNCHHGTPMARGTGPEEGVCSTAMQGAETTLNLCPSVSRPPRSTASFAAIEQSREGLCTATAPVLPGSSTANSSTTQQTKAAQSPMGRESRRCLRDACSPRITRARWAARCTSAEAHGQSSGAATSRGTRLGATEGPSAW